MCLADRLVTQVATLSGMRRSTKRVRRALHSILVFGATAAADCAADPGMPQPPEQSTTPTPGPGWKCATRMSPTRYSPELKPVECLWTWLKTRHLSNRVYVNYDGLLAAGTADRNQLTRGRIHLICRTAWLRRTN